MSCRNSKDALWCDERIAELEQQVETLRVQYEPGYLSGCGHIAHPEVAGCIIEACSNFCGEAADSAPAE